MIFNVPEMSCGHCTAAIEKAVKAADSTAQVTCDLGTHTVSVSGTLSAQAAIDAMRGAGYAATPQG